MALARRLAVAVAAVLGLVLAVSGAWFAFVLGPKATASFHATSDAPLVIGPNVLNRVNAPVRVSANAASGPVFLGAAVPQDADDVVGQSRHNFVASASFPGGSLVIEQIGSGELENPTASHVWRSTGEGSITVPQDEAPQSVLAYPTQGGPFDVDVTVARNTWFLQSLVALVVGLIVVAFAGGWLWLHGRATPARNTEAQPVEAEQPEGGHPEGARPEGERPEGERPAPVAAAPAAENRVPPAESPAPPVDNPAATHNRAEESR